MQDAPQQGVQAGAEGQYETRELPLVVPNAPASGSATGMPVTAPPPSTAQNGNALPSTAAAGNYAVNFGAYATEADADAVIAHLKKSNLPGFRQPDTINGRQAWRVRIGPYADRAQAELVRLEAGKVRGDVNAQVVVLDATREPTAPVAVPARGKTVCSCFGVSESAIGDTLARCQGSEVERLAQLQDALKCGTNCGSCVPELQRMVRAVPVALREAA